MTTTVDILKGQHPKSSTSIELFINKKIVNFKIKTIGETPNKIILKASNNQNVNSSRKTMISKPI